MLQTYRDAAQSGYYATYFLRMVMELGGVKAAKQLIHDPKFSSGFTTLWEQGALDISVEALVLKSEWHDLFGDDDRKVAREKLAKVEYFPK